MAFFFWALATIWSNSNDIFYLLLFKTFDILSCFRGDGKGQYLTHLHLLEN